MSETSMQLRELNREYERAARRYRNGELTNAQLLRVQARIRAEKDSVIRQAGGYLAGHGVPDWNHDR